MTGPGALLEEADFDSTITMIEGGGAHVGWYSGKGTGVQISASLDLVRAEVEAVWAPPELGGVGLVVGECRVEKIR